VTNASACLLSEIERGNFVFYLVIMEVLRGNKTEMFVICAMVIVVLGNCYCITILFGYNLRLFYVKKQP